MHPTPFWYKTLFGILYVNIGLAIFCIWVFYARTEMPLQDGSPMFSNLVVLRDGEAPKPFVYRRLLVDGAQLVSQLIPAATWQGIELFIRKSNIQPLLDSYGWNRIDYPFLITAYALIYLSIVGFMLSIRWLLRVLYDGPRWVVDVLALLFGWLILGCVGGAYYNLYGYDLPNLFLFTLCLALLFSRNWLFFPCFALLCYSKETAVLMLFVYACNPLVRGLPGYLLSGSVLAAMYGGIQLYIRSKYVSSVEGTFWFPDRNTGILFLFLTNWVWDAIFWILVGLSVIFGNWSRSPVQLRRCLPLVPLMVGLAFCKGWVEERRAYLELLPIVGILLIQACCDCLGWHRLLRARTAGERTIPAGFRWWAVGETRQMKSDPDSQPASSVIMV